MLTAVRFDDDVGAEMNEIDNVFTNRLLSAEFFTEQAMRPQMPPKRPFRIGHSATQLSCAVSGT